MFTCADCKRKFSSTARLELHFCDAKQYDLPENFGIFHLMCHAFKKFLAIYTTIEFKYPDLSTFFSDQVPNVEELLLYMLDNLGPYKVQFCLGVEMKKPLPDKELVEYVRMCSGMFAVTLDELIKNVIKEFQDVIQLTVDQFTERGSGWTISTVKSLEVRIAKYQAHRGGCSNNELPVYIKNKKACLSIGCSSDCFMYSVLASLHPQEKHSQRATKYEMFKDLYDFSDVRGVVRINDIGKFERKNRISVNVYTIEKGLIPLQVRKKCHKRHINLLLYNDHYYLIKNFNRLCADKNSRGHVWCFNCLNGFRTQERLNNHLLYCLEKDGQRIELPKDPSLYFKQFNKTLKHPFIIYADFETLVKKESDGFASCKFEACSFGLVVVDWNQDIVHSQFYRGDDAARKFITSLKALGPTVKDWFDLSRKPLVMSDEEEKEFQQTENCSICGQLLGDDRVRDHDHMTGMFRGAAHNKCNLKLRFLTKVPVVFHNLKNFDAHLIVQGIDKDTVNNIEVIPQTTEKYIAMTIDDFVFIDSYAFLSSSLDTLAANANPSLKRRYLNCFFEQDKSHRLTNKATLPYEYLDSMERFNETSLPPKEAFYSTLKNETITDEVFQRMQNIWHLFACRDLGDFHDIYLAVDVCLLAAVFEEFREMSLKEFGLDPSHFFSSPGLTWAAALKYTGVTLELLTDIDMILLVEKGIRGGISTAIKHHAKANNPSVQGYDPSKPTSYIAYLDVNNLYGYALKQPMPYKNFKWVEEDKLQEVLTRVRAGSSDKGYIFEVDLCYPAYLHDAHNDYPLAPEKLVIDDDELSPYQQQLLLKLKDSGQTRVKSEKLIPNLRNKQRYVVHYKNLVYYMEKGLVVEKVHRALEFDEKPWIEPYVMLCTSKRQQARSAFEKDFWKLLVNSLFGKSIENKRKYSQIKVIMDKKKLAKNISKPVFDEFLILDEEKVFAKLRKTRIVLDKPIYLGFTVLELSKLLMFQLHYDTFKKYYDDKIELIYTDTDSFIYHIQTDDLVRDFKHFSGIMDFCDYPKDHELFNEKNKKVLGKLKDEMNGQPINEVIAIKSKLYFIDSPVKQQKRAKGVQRSVVEQHLTKDLYLRCLFDHEIHYNTVRRIGSDAHKIVGVETRKISLSPLDDKRHSIDAVRTYAFGHYKTLR